VSYETRYATAMRQRSDAASSTPEAAAARAKLQDALNRARADAKAEFPVLAADTIEAALDYQERRILYWRKELGA
jgi:hypothetical protein